MVRYKDSDDPKEWIRRADEAFGRNDAKTAVSCLKKAVKLDPKNAELLKHLATVSAQFGNGGDALHTMRKVSKLTPVSFDTWYKLALILAQKGAGLSALDAMREAMKINPDCGKEWYQISVHIEETGDSRRAGIALYEASKLGYTPKTKPQVQEKKVVRRSRTPSKGQVELVLPPMPRRQVAPPRQQQIPPVKESTTFGSTKVNVPSHLKDRISTFSDVITKSILKPWQRKQLRDSLAEGLYDEIENRFQWKTSYGRGSIIHTVRIEHSRAEGAKKTALLELLKHLEKVILDDVRETAIHAVYEFMNMLIGNPKYTGNAGSMLRATGIAVTLSKKYSTQDPLSSVKAFISLSKEHAPPVDDKRVVLGTIAGMLRDVKQSDPKISREDKLLYQDAAAAESMQAQRILDEDWTNAMKIATKRLIEAAICLRIRRADKEELLKLYLDSFVTGNEMDERFLKKNMHESKLGVSRLQKIIAESSLTDSEKELCQKLLAEE
ncbi:MAG: tetratricopeptide repeat protein [Candidatus Thorarchaeota archaeon]